MKSILKNEVFRVGKTYIECCEAFYAIHGTATSLADLESIGQRFFRKQCRDEALAFIKTKRHIAKKANEIQNNNYIELKNLIDEMTSRMVEEFRRERTEYSNINKKKDEVKTVPMFRMGNAFDAAGL